MSDYPRQAIDRIRTKLHDGDYDISSDDANMLLEMSDEIDLLGQSAYSDQRHEFYLKRCKRMAEHVGGLAAALDNRDAAEAIVRWIHTTYDNPESNKDYRVALRNFGSILADGDDPPASLRWIPGGYPDNYDPAPDPSDMLRWNEDIQPMLDACHNLRDRALIALAWDLGPRPRELFELTPGDLTDHKYGLQVTVSGKKGQRSPLLIPSVPHVRRWLDVHPGGPDDALWSQKNAADAISNNRIRDILKERARDADVTRPVTPSNFRKSSASHLANQGVSQAHLEDHHGWERGSEIATRYVSVFADANDRAVAAAHGVDVEEDAPEPTAPVECTRCGRETPREDDVCVWCGQALSQEASENVDAAQSALFQSRGSIDDAELDLILEEMFEAVLEDPEMRAEAARVMANRRR